MLTLVELVTLVTAVVAAVAGVAVLRRRRTSTLALPLALMMFGASEWAAARALLPFAEGSVRATVGLEYAVFPGVAVVVFATFWYFLSLTGRRLSRRGGLLLAVHPTLLAGALVTNPAHQAFLTVAVDAGRVQVDPGPLFWWHTAYSYLLLLAGLVLVLRAMVRAVPGHRHVFVVAALAAMLPVLGNVLGTVIAATSENQHLTPVFFLASASIWWWVERTRGHTRVVPVSTREVLEALTDGVVVLDPRGHLLGVNPAARALLRGPGRGGRDEQLIGSAWLDHVAPELVGALAGGRSGLVTTARGTVLDVRVTELRRRAGRSPGTVVVLRDVTELERLRDELAHQASHDALTEVPNRRSFEQRLADAVVSSRTSGSPVSVVALDLDHFKAINDTHGHAVGDRVLVEVARALSRILRPGETVARVGGEEFVLLLPGADAQDAVARAEEARAACAGVQVPVRGGTVGVTTSVGVAQLSPDGSAEGLIREADRAMYAAKAAGRDRVVRAGEPTPSR